MTVWITLFITLPPQAVPSAFPSPLCSSGGETGSFIWRLDFSYSLHVCLQNPFGKKVEYSLGILSLKIISCRAKKKLSWLVVKATKV